MSTEKNLSENVAAARNEDPITHEPGAHPLATGVGAAGAGTIGVAIGTAVAGPIGALVGAAVGAFVGGLGGSAVGEAIDPTAATPESADNAAVAPASDRREGIRDDSLLDSVETGLTPFTPITAPLQDGILPTEFLLRETGTAYRENGGKEVASTDEIQRRAWEIYQEEGFPEGRDLEHWLRAERELVS